MHQLFGCTCFQAQSFSSTLHGIVLLEQHQPPELILLLANGEALDFVDDVSVVFTVVVT